MSIRVFIRSTIEITDFVKSATLSGDSETLNRQLNLEMTGTTDGRKAAIKIEEGDLLTFRVDGVLRFLGIVFSQTISSDGNLSVTAYDSNVYLAKSNDTRIFTNKKASDIIRIIARDFDIPLGDVADTGYVIPYLRLSNRTLRDMVLAALKITRHQTGKRFFISNVAGRLTLTEGAKKYPRYVFRDRENLISATYTRSIEDTKTQVKVIGGKKGKETVVVVKDAEKRNKYGVLQALEVMDDSATASQVKQRASTLLKEQSSVDERLSIEVLGVADVDIGTPVYVQNDMTLTSSGYYVTTVSHNHSGGLHTMTLDLSKGFDLPDIEITEEMTKRDKEED